MKKINLKNQKEVHDFAGTVVNHAIDMIKKNKVPEHLELKLTRTVEEHGHIATTLSGHTTSYGTVMMGMAMTSAGFDMLFDSLSKIFDNEEFIVNRKEAFVLITLELASMAARVFADEKLEDVSEDFSKTFSDLICECQKPKTK